MKKQTVALVNCLAIVSAICISVVGVAQPALALPTARVCQANVARGQVRYFTAAALARQKCIKKQLKGAIAADVDCLAAAADVKDERTKAALVRADKALRIRIAGACVGVDLSEIGFPGGCADSTPGDDTFTELDLLSCTESATDAMISHLLPVETPSFTDMPFVPDAYLRCGNVVSDRGRRLVSRELRARGNCLVRQARRPNLQPTDADLNCTQRVPPYGPGTGDDTTDGAVIGAQRSLLTAIPGACVLADVRRIYADGDCPDTTAGSFTMFDLQLCQFDEHRAAASTLLAVVFPPLCGNGETEVGEECDNGDLNSDTAPNACRTNCKLPSCGDGVVDGSNGSGEQCDDGNDDNSDNCLNTCVAATCGDGFTCSAANCTSGAGGAPEQCDDGNGDNGDACLAICVPNTCGDGFVNPAAEACDGGGATATCDNDCTPVECGDGNANSAANEQCDDGNTNNADSCLNDCKTARCGDGVLCTALNCTSGPGGGPESCDDANTSSNDGCSATCDAEICGDGITQPPREQCDDGFANNSDTQPDACRTNCTNPRCGDSVVDSGEDCDDGNTLPGDNCDENCQQEKCGNGQLDADFGEECDDGPGNSDTTPNACRTNCKLPTCGDGIIDGGAPFNEQCDDGNTSNNDRCLATCIPATCGDGVICSAAGCNTGPAGGVEQCDDGNQQNNDACLTTCATNVCGDSFVNPAVEACDEGGETATCDDDCTAVSCGDGNTNQAAGEQCDTGGASATCTDQCTIVGCGDGVVTTAAGEECDDGNTNDNDVCPGNCKDAVCGDGFTCSDAACTSGPGGGAEFCDDAGVSATCDSDCSAPACGDGLTNGPAGEQCDTSGESATCDADCTNVQCGDGVINATAGEECDDGNTTSGDGCSSTCKCGAGSGEGGCVDPKCPAFGELTLYAGTTGILCTGDGDCPVGTCNTELGRCVTATDLDTGWTGLGHNADINDQVLTQGNLSCPGPFDSGSDEPCGECEVTGLRPDTNNCRCRQNNRLLCFDPFAVDDVDCGVPVSCQFPSDCKVCSESTSISCFVDDDCPGDEFCMNGLRQPECDKSSGSGSSTCSQIQTRSCGSTADCEIGEFCGAGICRTKATGAATCTALGTSTGCATGELCAGTCAGDTTIQCTANNECPSGTRPCNPSFCAAPTPARCTADGDCANGQQCGDGFCRTGGGPSCSQDSTCVAGPFGQPEYCLNQGSCVGFCDCYFGPPLPLSSSNTPACVVNRFAKDISGLVNVDRGSGTIAAELRAVVYLGEAITIPCPVCGGKCSGGTLPGIPCLFDSNCPGSGTCEGFDDVVGDGVRNGTCYLGDNIGQSCDIDAYHETFPAPGGGGSSLDCFPSLGKNVSGTGLVIKLTQSTGSSTLESKIPCYFPFSPQTCTCGACGSPQGEFPCSTNADCPEGTGACVAARNIASQQNGCSDLVCTPRGDGTGTCAAGPSSQFCDGVLKANGDALVTCLSNADCAGSDCGPVSCGACTLQGARDCFPPTIVAQGVEDPQFPIGAAAFCIGQTANPGINTVAGLPGPGRVLNQAESHLFCASDPAVEYVPGAGGCP